MHFSRGGNLNSPPAKNIQMKMIHKRVLLPVVLLLFVLPGLVGAEIEYCAECWYLNYSTETIFEEPEYRIKSNEKFVPQLTKEFKTAHADLSAIIDKPKEKQQKRDSIKNEFNITDVQLDSVDKYPVRLYYRNCTFDNKSAIVECTLIDRSHKLTQKTVNTLTGADFDFSQIPFEDNLVLQIGFDTIEYVSSSNTMTVIGDATCGDSSGNACDFTDIYNADVAGGWGMVLRQGTNQFKINCKLRVGNSSTNTWFADNNKQVEFSPVGIYAQPLTVTSNANFRLGTVIDANKYTTKNGCSLSVGFYFYFIDAQNADSFEIYSSDLKSTTGVYAPDVRVPFGSKIWNSIFSDAYPMGNSVDIRNVVEYAGNNYASTQCNVTSDNWVIHQSKNGIVGFGNYGFAVRNIKLIDSTKDFFFSGLTTDCYAINTECDWLVSWSGVCTRDFYRQNTFDLKVTDEYGNNINGASVNMWDKDGTLIVDTATAAGVIAEQTLTRGYYDQANGSILQDASPHTLTISQPGYQTYTEIFTMDKINWTVALSPETSEGTVSIMTLPQTGARKTTTMCAAGLMAMCFIMILSKKRGEP